MAVIIAKLFEIRDEGTIVPVMATKCSDRNWDNQNENWLWDRAGYAEDYEYVILYQIDGGRGRLCCDPYDWSNRTMATAHHYIKENFDTLHSGEVIDVEFILGETKTKKVSEHLMSGSD